MVGRQGEAARLVPVDSQEGAVRQDPAVRLGPPVRSDQADRTAAAQGGQGREDPPEEDREAAQSRPSRRAAVVKWLDVKSGHLVILAI